MDFLKIKTSVFICTGWTCSKCGFHGDVEVHTLGIGVPGTTYNAGDQLGEGIVGNQEHFDAFLCPKCTEQMDFTLRGVTLHVVNGRYSGAVFC